MNTEARRRSSMSLLLERKKADMMFDHKLLFKLNRIQEDYWWIAVNYNFLLKTYNNELIAVKDKRVVFKGNTFEALASQILASNNSIDDFAIEQIKKQPVCLLL
jgi:hypothetical protein